MTDHQRPHEMREETIITPGQRRHHALDAYATSGTSPPAESEPRHDRAELNSVTQHAMSLSLEPLVTTRQLAELWCETPRWVLRMAKEQGLPHYRLGEATRFRPSEAEAWLQQHRVGGDHTTRDQRPIELRPVTETRGAA